MEGLLGVVVLLLAGGALGEVSKEYEDYIMATHNEYRSMQHASNMHKLVWNDTLGEIADRWLQNCHFDHENKGFGENLGFQSENMGGTKGAMNSSFTAWYDEIKPYRAAGRNSCGGSGSCHYTQLVWAITRQVGCAHRLCKHFTYGTASAKDISYFGCWYFPPGNFGDDKPFETGAPCADCWEGQTCEDGLCAGEGKEPCFDRNKDCVMYAANGNCGNGEYEGQGSGVNNKAWMQVYCRQSCKYCEGGEKRVCKDSDANCSRYVKNLKGDNKKKACDTPYMKQECPVSCDFCTP